MPLNSLPSRILGARPTRLLAVILATFPFWSSGIAKLVAFDRAMEEMQAIGLQPASFVAGSVVVTQLVGSMLILTGRAAWFGAAALAGFTLLTIPVAHAFWTMEGERATMEMLIAIEHIGVVGGLLAVAILQSGKSGA